MSKQQKHPRFADSHTDMNAESLAASRTPSPQTTTSSSSTKTDKPASKSSDSRTAEKRAESRARPPERKKRDPGRDETLSDYLSSLGAIPLLTAEEEHDLARDLRDAEEALWVKLLEQSDVVTALAEAPLMETAPKDILVRHVRRAKKAGIGKSPAVRKDILALAEFLRANDDDRNLAESMLTMVTTSTALESGTRKHKEQLERNQELVTLRRRAMRLRNRFVRSNLRLVVSVARRFHHYRMPLIDLIQEGNLGLIKSVHRFDHRRGFRFSTYAHWWIRQAIERAIMNKGAQVRLPVHIFDARREVAKATRDLAQSLGRDPLPQEIADSLGQPIEKLDEIMRVVPREPISLDDPIGDDEDRTLGETIADSADFTPDESVISVDQSRHVRRILKRLTPMEIDIIERRFGLIQDQDETLEEIGRSYSLSRERVRQIQVQGLKKMQRVCERLRISA